MNRFPVPSSAKDNDEGLNLDMIVLRYLRHEGYREAEKELLKHMAIKRGVEFIPPERIPRTDYLKYEVMSKLFPKSMDGNFDYAQSYVRMHDFVMSLLYMYRADLERLLYPIYLFCVLDLLCLAGEDALVSFFAKVSPLLKFASVPGRMEEIREIESLRNVGDIEQVPIASKFWNARVTITLSRQSVDLLTQFLHENRLFCILRVLHGLDLKLYAGLPRADCLEPITVESRVAIENQREACVVNAKALNAGLLPHIPEDGVPLEDGDDAKPRPGAKKTKACFLAGSASRIKPTLPFIPLDEEIAQRHQTDVASRERVTPDRLPSILCATFHNTYRTMTACHVLANETQIAAGFSDATVRLLTLHSDRAEEEDDLDESDGDGDAAMADAEARSRARGGAGGGRGERQGRAREPFRPVDWIGHGGAITALTSTADEKVVLSAATDGTVRLWSLELSRCLVSYASHLGPIWALSASPRCPYFATGGWDGAAFVWSTERKKPLRILAGHSGDVNCVAWHPNGHYVATGGRDKTVRLWDVGESSNDRLGDY